MSDWPRGGSTAAHAAPVQQVFDYVSSVTSDAGGSLDLIAELNYDTSMVGAPIAVVMHPFSANDGTLANIRKNAQPLRDKGFFSVSVAMRGRDGSDGVRDSGGLEIYDIFDAVEAVKATYGGQVDPDLVYITGYSGGGGNTMSALTKFPDYFAAGASIVGMSDYGYDGTDGWYFNGAGGRTSILNRDIGNRITGGSVALDAYHARASNLASKNNPYSEIHLFANVQETISPVVNNTSYWDNAIAAATFVGEFDNITVHTGDGSNPAWVDHNGDGIVQDDERQDYPHSSATRVQDRAEAWFLDRLLAGEIPAPVLNDADNMFVAGWVRTKRFEVFLGDGQDAAAELEYVLGSARSTFALDVVSTDETKTGRVTLDTTAWDGQDAEVFLDGLVVESLTLGESFTYDALGDGETLSVGLVLRGDFNASGSVEQGDLDLVLGDWGQSADSLGVDWVSQRPGTASVDQAELDAVLVGWGSTLSPVSVNAVLEPGAAFFVVLGASIGWRRVGACRLERG